MNKFDKELEFKKIDLCSEIEPPIGSITCEKNIIDESSYDVNCYLTISGDSRVSYKFNEYGFWGVSGGKTNAGVRTKLTSSNQDTVEIIPFDDSTLTECTEKRDKIWRSMFYGFVLEISGIR